MRPALSATRFKRPVAAGACCKKPPELFRNTPHAGRWQSVLRYISSGVRATSLHACTAVT
jgi:hypothetical protein